MKSRLSTVIALCLSLPLACSSDNSSWGFEEDLRSDLVAFTDSNTGASFQMRADGTDVRPLHYQESQVRYWPNQKQILNSVCGGWSDDLDDHIELVSPDGAALGLLDDNWKPVWSPTLDTAAVACGRRTDGTVVVVANVESRAKSKEWSRTGRGEVSDGIEIYLVRADGTALTQLTSNRAGDWLPQWHPSGSWLLIESNRDGDSEIYQLAVDSTESWRLTERESYDQWPALSQSGEIVAFASDAGSGFQIYVVPTGATPEPFMTNHAGRPLPWRN